MVSSADKKKLTDKKLNNESFLFLIIDVLFLTFVVIHLILVSIKIHINLFFRRIKMYKEQGISDFLLTEHGGSN